MAEKMRVHILAKELNVSSKVIIEKCKAEGIASVTNHMSTLSAGLHATILEWFSEGAHETTVETSHRVDLNKVRLKRRRSAGKEAAETPSAPEDAPTATAIAESKPPETVEVTPAMPEPVPEIAAEADPIVVAMDQAPAVASLPPIPVAPPLKPPPKPVAETPRSAAPSKRAPVAAEVQKPAPAKARIIPAGPQNVPGKAKVTGPRVVRYEAPGTDAGLGPHRGPATTITPVPPVAPEGGEAGLDRDAAARKRQRASPRRSAARLVEAGERMAEWRDQDLQERRDRLAGATGRRIHRRQTASHAMPGAPAAPSGPKTQFTIHEPVRMKELLAATGLNFIQCFKVLRDEHQTLANVNMVLPPEIAELLALHFGIELTVVPAQTAIDELQAEFAARPRGRLISRPPVVTVLGHVDHGKTSLLDAVRRTRVAASEDGGITQHIGAYHIQTAHGPVTFLDTPGHEAFTAMRARGAQLTDVVVLVVAANDGVMPQTVEAMSHAKAASVPIVVAMNKIDLGDQNKLKIFGQLSEHGLTPSGDWGGEVDVIPTSAVSGVGIKELVEHLADLSSLLDLKADPTLPASGTVIESETKPGAGPVVRLLVQEGTLRTGDFVVCGPAYGKVRALLDDRNERIDEAGPSIPVEVWGLDDVPTAGDKLYVLDNLKRAAEIAAQVKQTRIESARVQTRRMRTLEEMLKRRGADEVPDLNVVIKADVDGSVSAIKHTLEDIPSDEVRLTIRHAGVGPITDSDILLATACDGLVVAFRVDVPAGVRRLAEQNGVDVRSYRVIYDVCDDIKKALEGLLEPEEHIESRGVAEVRQIFRLGKRLGIIAGSYVVDGTLDRSHFANVVRDGTIVRERCKFASLRRFKDDVREVRAGLECGIRLEGFDDVHVGDKIQTFEVVKIARTLQLTRA